MNALVTVPRAFLDEAPYLLRTVAICEQVAANLLAVSCKPLFGVNSRNAPEHRTGEIAASRSAISNGRNIHEPRVFARGTVNRRLGGNAQFTGRLVVPR